MSLSLKKLEVINVKDPRVMVNTKKDYVYLEGAMNVSSKQYTTTSVSNAALNFTCPPPSMSTFVDRKTYLRASVRLTFTGLSTDIGQYLVNGNQDAPRAYGLSSAIDVVNCTINNYTVTNNIGDYVHPLVDWYNVGDNIRYHQYSTTPTYPDQSQLYSSLDGSIRNPLGGYGDGINNQTPRGGFSRYRIASQTVIVGGAPQAQPSTATGQIMTTLVDIVFTEPLFLISPFFWGEKETNPFVNISTMDFTFNMINQGANRMWSRSETALNLSSLSFQFANLIPQGAVAFSFPEQQPVMLFNYFTPKESQIVPRDKTYCYPFFDIQRFPTDINAIAFNTSSTRPSNNVQLSSIPNRIYLYVRPQNNLILSSSTFTDSYAAIDRISIQYYNRTGICSSMSREQLYQMSVKNGCNMSWEQWSGESVYKNNNLNLPQYNTVGSVICIEPACDLGLTSLQAPGKIDHNTFQVDVTFRTLNPNAANYSIYIIVVNEGVFSIAPGITTGQIGVLTSEDILEARSKPYINYENIKDIYGGDFLSGLKSFWFDKVLPFLKKTKLASTVAKHIPVVGPAISSGLEAVGYGYGDIDDRIEYGNGVLVDDYGGVMVGGRGMSKKKLKSSMRKRVMM